MATEVQVEVEKAEGVVLEGISWKLYCSLRDVEESDRVRMTYLDGTLILMSPQYIHDRGSFGLGQIVVEVAVAHTIEIEPTLTTTLRRKGLKRRKGFAKEPDQGFYIGDHAEMMRQKEDIDLAIDPPPDLAIEVDNKADSEVALPIYARIRVPEVWRYESRQHRLWFGRLEGDTYVPIGRSVALPMLTQDLVLDAINVLVENRMGFIAWKTWLTRWAQALPAPPAAT